MDTNGINLIELFGPWLIVVIMALAILKRVESAIWVHKSQVETLMQLTEQVIKQYELRLVERDAAIDRQQQLLARNSRVAESSTGMVTTLLRSVDAQEGNGGE